MEAASYVEYIPEDASDEGEAMDEGKGKVR